jgi:hypothetical protein
MKHSGFTWQKKMGIRDKEDIGKMFEATYPFHAYLGDGYDPTLMDIDKGDLLVLVEVGQPTVFGPICKFLTSSGFVVEIPSRHVLKRVNQ